jgi:hypothetical protein
MNSKAFAAAVILVLTSWGTRPASAISFLVQSISYPGDPAFTQLLGINNGGTIVGTHNSATPQGFTLTLPNTFTSQNFPGSVSTTVTAINSNGDTAGTYVDAGGTSHGFTRVGGTFTTVDQPGTVFNQTLGINASSNTVGYSAATKAGTTNQMAYSQSGGVFTNINPLLPTNSNSQATGLNNAGNIVGFYMPTNATSIGFLDMGGVITSIDPFGSLFTQALGINNAGEIVGFYDDAGGVQHGYVDIGGVFISFDPAGSDSTTINGVNDLGQIVGFFTDVNDNTIGFVGTPVSATPLPAALPLFATGLGAMGLLGWRRKRRGQAAI